MNLTPALLAPIETRADAEAFLRALDAAGLMFHLEDDACDCLSAHLSPEECDTINDQVHDVYEAWTESGADMMNDCPIAYCLSLDPEYNRQEPNNCAECARSFGPHYSGPCDH